MDKMVKKSPSEYEYMIIEGVQSTTSDEEKMMGQGELAARESISEIRQHLEGAELVYIAAGLGGGCR